MTSKTKNTESHEETGIRLRRTALFGVLVLTGLWANRAPQSSWVANSLPTSLTFMSLMALVYALVHTTAIKFRFGRVSNSVNVAEIPLIAGLVLLGPLWHLVARVVGQALGNFFRLRASKNNQLKWVLLANSSQGGLEVTVFSMTASAMGFAGQFDERGILAVTAAYLVANLSSPMLWLVFHASRDDRFPVRKMMQSVKGAFRLSFIVFLVPITFLTLLTTNAIAAGLLAVLFLGVVRPLRQYAVLSSRAEETANLFHFSDLLSQSRDGTDFSAILNHAAKTARAGESEVVLLNVRNLAPGNVLVIRGESRISQPVTSLPHEWPEIMSEGTSRIKSAEQTWRGAKTAMAAPLLVNGEAIGLLVVSSHGDEFHNFADEDVVILETLARHLALWLEQDRLLDALEVEIEERSHDALRDPITDLGNRAAFTAMLSGLIEQDRECTVLLLNLTHFKVVNEHYGHDAGDRVLAAIAKRIEETVPADAFVARLGGDEFTVCLTGKSLRQGQSVAADLIRAFRRPHHVGGDEVEIGAAIGIAQYPTHGTDVTMLMRSADTAMYQAKSTTEGVFIHEAPSTLTAGNSLARTVQLRRAIEGFCVIPHYQPLVDLQTGAVTGFEALARWQTAPGQFAPPDEFIALAEETHLIHELTVQMASHALTDLAAWRSLEGYEAITVSVNISPVSLGRHDVTEQLLSVLRQLQLPTAALTLEITESRVMEDPERSIRHLRTLADQGLRLAIDDFGAGQTSLSYLADLPVHQLKIDRSFLLEAVEKPTARRLLATMIALGRDLDHMVTVEGIETAGHWCLVRDLGAHKAQGYFVAKAMSSSVTADWLRTDGRHLLELLGVGVSAAVGPARK